MVFRPVPPTVYEVDGDGNPALIEGTVLDSGSLEEMVKAYSDKSNIFTIFTRRQNKTLQDEEVPGFHFRKVLFADDCEILSTKTRAGEERYIHLTVPMPHWEEDHPTPLIYVEQRIFQNGSEKIQVLQLSFGGKIQVGAEYLFRACGDEDTSGSKRDLRLRVLSISGSSFERLMMNGRHYGFDTKDVVRVDEWNIVNGLNHLPRLPGKQEAPIKIHMTRDDLESLRDAKRHRMLAGGFLPVGEHEILRLRLTDNRDPPPGRMYLEGLDLRVVYKF